MALVPDESPKPYTRPQWMVDFEARKERERQALLADTSGYRALDVYADIARNRIGGADCEKKAI